MTLRQLAIPILVISLIGCQELEAPDETDPEPSSPGSPLVQGAAGASQAGPAPVAIAEAPRRADKVPLSLRLRPGRTDHVVVFEGTVQSLTGDERRVPARVLPEGWTPIVTDVGLTSVEPICGEAPVRPIVTHLGGRVGKRRQGHSDQPNLRVGSRYLFAATEIDGAYYLVGERRDVLDVDGSTYTDPSGNALDLTTLKGMCQ